MRVTKLQITPVKGTRIHAVDSIALGLDGAAGDRRFYVIDERGRMQNDKTVGALMSVAASYASDVLTLEFPDGPAVSGPVELGERVATQFFSRPREDVLVVGPWARALSEFSGRSLRLVATNSAVDRGGNGRASLISRASLERLAEVAGVDAVDERRFRMLIEVDGVLAHEEDLWIGRTVQVGDDAVIRWNGNVGRCLVTGMDPDTGAPTLPTLDILGTYRRDVETTEPLPFGIYGEVVRPGAIRVGDPVIVGSSA